ncbi:hypothetical protein [Pseudomonas phage vB_PseuGesM_254]|uniref:Uncharacterized protein n=1 Tax=Pseudomonas phage vB_PseuGesM_254 TaxID=3092638 RepID=A0AAX4G6P5_9CAUD|nr:hypothetical protein [Pseudomonas phage PseuGes_254]
MSDKIQPGNTVMWAAAFGGWCDLYVVEGVNDRGTFTAKIINSEGFESHIGETCDDWQPEYVK